MDRERLRSLLETAPDARLVLVSAPAGFGKSTVLAAWLGEADVRGAWLSLDSHDNDIVRFSRYLGAAATQLAGGGDPLALDVAEPFDAELALVAILDALTGACAEAPPWGCLLVLDDYHVISEPAIHRLVALLLERLPPRARLAIATRADPPLPLARLRARGELLEIRAEDLRFTTAEAAELLRSAEVEVTPAEVAELTDRTEGWAAALHLAAVSLRGRADHADLVRRFGASHRFVLDYVVDEVLTGLPPDSQDFLVRTSILDRLSGPLCDAVTGQAGGQARIEDLERQNLLIVPLDDERHWYRYHALFADILRNRLALLAPDEVVELHRRASQWYESQGQADEAIQHSLQAGDVGRAARIVGGASLTWIDGGELGTVRRWLDALPRDVVRASAQLSASYAWCLVLAGEAAGVAERLADAESAFAAGPEHSPLLQAMLPAELAMIRSRLADLEGDLTTAIEQARIARGLVPHGLPPPASSASWAATPAGAEAVLRGDASIMLGNALRRSGDLLGASEAYEAALDDVRVGGNTLGVGHAVSGLAWIDIENGEPAAALRRCEAQVTEAGVGASGIADGAVWLAMAEALLGLGLPERAESAARRGLEFVTRGGDAARTAEGRALLERISRSLPLGSSRAATAILETRRATVDALTARELEVLRLVARGRSNRQIASELYLTVGTVKTHVHRIVGKLAASNRVEALVRAREQGLL